MLRLQLRFELKVPDVVGGCQGVSSCCGGCHGVSRVLWVVARVFPGVVGLPGCFQLLGGCQGVSKVLWVVTRVFLRCCGWLPGCF